MTPSPQAAHGEKYLRHILRQGYPNEEERHQFNLNFYNAHSYSKDNRRFLTNLIAHIHRSVKRNDPPSWVKDNFELQPLFSDVVNRYKRKYKRTPKSVEKETVAGKQLVDELNRKTSFPQLTETPRIVIKIPRKARILQHDYRYEDTNNNAKPIVKETEKKSEELLKRKIEATLYDSEESKRICSPANDYRTLSSHNLPVSKLGHEENNDSDLEFRRKVLRDKEILSGHFKKIQDTQQRVKQGLAGYKAQILQLEEENQMEREKNIVLNAELEQKRREATNMVKQKDEKIKNLENGIDKLIKLCTTFKDNYLEMQEKSKRKYEEDLNKLVQLDGKFQELERQLDRQEKTVGRLVMMNAGTGEDKKRSDEMEKILEKKESDIVKLQEELNTTKDQLFVAQTQIGKSDAAIHSLEEDIRYKHQTLQTIISMQETIRNLSNNQSSNSDSNYTSSFL